MHLPNKRPGKRRRTIGKLPHLAAYLGIEKPTVQRVGLDPITKCLLQRLLIDEDLAMATWYSQLAYRLIHENSLEARIHRYAGDVYCNVPMLGESPTLITIPRQLRKVLRDASEGGPFVDKRGALSIWLRAAICYIALEEKKIPFSPLSVSAQWRHPS